MDPSMAKSARNRSEERARPIAISGPESPTLSVIVVNYCQWHGTAGLVRNLTATSRAVEVVLVDNHSPGHPLVRRLRRWPGVSLRRWRRNQGFARAVNEGFRLSRGDWLLLLNPDVTLPANFADSLLALIQDNAARDPRAGIIGLQLRNADGSVQGSWGRFPTLVSSVARLVLPRSRRKYQPPGQRGRAVDWVTGCCLLVRRDCLQQLRGLDEAFFLYYEDVDLCRRARQQGWAVWYEPRLAVVHHRPLHSRPVGPLLRLLTRHALLTYAARHWPYWQRLLLTGLVGIESLLRRAWTAWHGDQAGAALFGQLALLALDMVQDRRQAAHLRLRQVLRQHGPMLATVVEDAPPEYGEILRKEAAGEASDRDSQPQSARPSRRLSAERLPLGPGGNDHPGGR
jgi:N-acetylglucosaminyl-diphospho-decaprenol L-rhamnosyltransferase